MSEWIKIRNYENYLINSKGIIKNNNALNLEWVTKSENTNHAYKTGLNNNSLGKNSHLCTLSDEKIVLIRQLLKTCIKQKDIAKKFNISPKHVSQIKLNQRRKYVK